MLTPKEDLPLGDRLQACYEAKKCGLAGARRSQQRNDLVGGKIKRSILNSLENLVLDIVIFEKVLNLQVVRACKLSVIAGIFMQCCCTCDKLMQLKWRGCT